MPEMEMRDPARIDRMLDKLRRIWASDPGLRLGQMIVRIRPLGAEPMAEMFFARDDDLEREMDKIIDERGLDNHEAPDARDTKDGGSASCAWCGDTAHIKQGRIMLCAVHYRFSSMRSRARRDGKVVPSLAELAALVPDPFDCIACGRGMTWLRESGASKQATLQHDRSGALRIICLACNTRHAQYPGDTYFDLPAGHKRCAKCERVLPHDSFCKDRSRPLGLKSSCRECSGKAHTKWRLENRDHYNAKQRENRVRRALTD